METMSGKLSSLDRRLAKVEQRLTDRARRKKLANCICREGTQAAEAEEFEVEMNRTCPVHGFRRLGKITPLVYVNPDKTFTEDSAKLLKLIETYELRVSRSPQS
jgi:hypothetical protein